MTATRLRRSQVSDYRPEDSTTGFNDRAERLPIVPDPGTRHQDRPTPQLNGGDLVVLDI